MCVNSEALQATDSRRMTDQIPENIEYRYIKQFEVIIMIQLSIVYSVAALKVFPGQLLFYLGIFSKGVFLKTVENSLPTPLYYRFHMRLKMQVEPGLNPS